MMMFEAILCGMFAFVFIEILCQPTEVFGWWPPLLRRIVFGSSAVLDFDDMNYLQLFLYKPWAGCGVCFSGWVAMVYFVLHYTNLDNTFLLTFPFWSFIFFLAGTIFMAWCLEKFKDNIT
jgi:hypothetical protein